MEKLILKDKTEILVEGGTTTNKFTTVVVGTDGVKFFLDNLSHENLATMELRNEAGITCAVLENKEIVDIHLNKIQKTDNWRILVTLKEKDVVMQRLEKLEKDQELQNNAIADISESVYS